MKLKRHYYLMISCPGDVVYERELLKKCVETINNERTDDVWVELQYWATDTSSDAGMQAQDSINEQIVNNSDALIAIFNARLGTPVHEYACGTDEEIALMLKAKKHVSLLFNTKPTIDLSNPNSIEQITKLQEYKNKQSKQAYYREFYDEDSFLTLARREILLWLRSVTISNPTTDIQTETFSPSQEIDIPPKENESLAETKLEDNPNKSFDSEAGMVDCVVYISDTAKDISYEMTNFTKHSNDFNNKTNVFVDKLSLYKKQKNSNGGILLLCKNFSSEISDFRIEANRIIDALNTKWTGLVSYMNLLSNKNFLNDQDKIIVSDSITTLQDAFQQSIPKFDKVIDTINSLPNFQKDLKIALGTLTNMYISLREFAIRAIQDCAEMEASINNNQFDTIIREN